MLKVLEIASDCINNSKDIQDLHNQFEKKLLNQSLTQVRLLKSHNAIFYMASL